MSPVFTVDDDLQMCATCGTQFDVLLVEEPEIKNCKICDVILFL